MNAPLVKDLLIQYWPDEIVVVGPTNVSDVAEGDVQFETVEGGQKLDISAALQTLILAATFSRQVVALYGDLRTQLGRKPTRDELSKAASKHPAAAPIDQSRRGSVAAEIHKRLG
jgi:hypothetical protein